MGTLQDIITDYKIIDKRLALDFQRIEKSPENGVNKKYPTVYVYFSVCLTKLEILYLNFCTFYNRNFKRIYFIIF